MGPRIKLKCTTSQELPWELFLPYEEFIRIQELLDLVNDHFHDTATLLQIHGSMKKTTIYIHTCITPHSLLPPYSPPSPSSSHLVPAVGYPTVGPKPIQS
jgi:hypothetical protein